MVITKVHEPGQTSTSVEKSPAEAKPKTTKEKETPAPKKTYTTFSIAAPRDGQTFYNQRQVPFTINLKPKLQEGDKIQMSVGGKPYGPPHSSTKFTVDNMYRGEHFLMAHIVNAEGKIIQSTAKITLYIHYTSIKNVKLQLQPQTKPSTPTVINLLLRQIAS